MSERKSKIKRVTKETQTSGELIIDGKGITDIKTPIGILSHMLDLFAFHGYFDLKLDIKGDTQVDIHHTNEDIGIALGKAFKSALGDLKGIKRFGSGFSPMESTLGHTVVDISGRGFLKLQVGYPGEVLSQIKDQEDYSMKYLEHFLESFAKNLGATINVMIENPDEDLHTNIETVFKSLGQALDQATQIDPRRAGAVPSTKGIID